MERKDMHLVNIYLKIHNKRPITMDDLRYLAKYSPECFEKTCKNVIYNRPETKPVMTPAAQNSSWNSPTPVPALRQNATEFSNPTAPPDNNTHMCSDSAPTEQDHITQILGNLSLLEIGDFPITHVDADEVKDLLGNLYMELLFPHNDKYMFFDMSSDTIPRFDRKA